MISLHRKQSTNQEPAYLHLQNEDFKPIQMDQFPDKSFKVRRAVPPGKVIFFFSFHGVPKVLNSYEIEQLKTPFSRELQFHGDIRKKVSMKLANSI